VRTKNDLPTGTYFADWALPEARRLTGMGYASQTVRTTLDSRLQAAARRAVERAPLGRAQVALVAMRPNGEVVAMIGGTDYATSPFNRGDSGAAPAGLDLQAVRLSRGARAGLGAGRPDLEHADRAGLVPAEELWRELFRKHHPGRCLCAVEQRRRGAACSGWSATTT
jgi:cell division protein FtsI/penicillin-binding protein 2